MAKRASHTTLENRRIFTSNGMCDLTRPERDGTIAAVAVRINRFRELATPFARAASSINRARAALPFPLSYPPQSEPKHAALRCTSLLARADEVIE
jgi:hypothetical protein